MLEGFPAPWALCSSPPRDVWAPQARERSCCISRRNQGTVWQRLGLLLSFASYCQTLGLLFLQAGSAKQCCSMTQTSLACREGALHDWNPRFKSPAEHPMGTWCTGGVKPVLHPTSDQLLSPTLCRAATPCWPHETTGILSGCTFLASQYSLLTLPLSLSCLYHSLSCFTSHFPVSIQPQSLTPPCQPTSPEELVPNINLGNFAPPLWSCD